MKKFGLIGYPLGHSFSQKYFTEKFNALDLLDHSYELFEMEHLANFESLWKDVDLVGVNVTVPHKQNVIPFLSRLDESASLVGAVNVIKREPEGLVGYNSDYFGFLRSLQKFLGEAAVKNALVLGTGGASKAVMAALKELKIYFKTVSRSEGKADLTYQELLEKPEMLVSSELLINTTPLGMHPNADTKPDIAYDLVREEQYFYDLVYNPEETAFMTEGKVRGASVINGLDMLYLQADRAWEIWNE